MARKKGQTYTAEQKAKIVLELLKEEKTISLAQCYTNIYLRIYIKFLQVVT